jgi:sialidase-1
MRKSTDFGRSWGPIRVVSTAGKSSGKKSVRNHGASIWDVAGKQIVLVLSVTPADTLAIMRSSDEGESWTAPRPLHELGEDSNAHVSPGRGLQLSTSHVHAGRILFAAQLSVNMGNVIFYSDDGGKSWVKSLTIVEHCNEAQMVELEDGRLLLNARDEDHKTNASVAFGARRFSHSQDGGHTWEPLGMLREDLGHTNCMGSFLAGDSQSNPLLFSHPNAPADVKQGRLNGTVWISHDQAKTFSPYLAVTPANSSSGFAYSCMTQLPSAEGTTAATQIGMLYETGDPGRCTGPSCRIMFKRFALPNDGEGHQSPKQTTTSRRRVHVQCSGPSCACNSCSTTCLNGLSAACHLLFGNGKSCLVVSTHAICNC